MPIPVTAAAAEARSTSPAAMTPGAMVPAAPVATVCPPLAPSGPRSVSLAAARVSFLLRVGCPADSSFPAEKNVSLALTRATD